LPAKLKELFENIAFDDASAEGVVLSVVHKNEEDSLLLQTEFTQRVPFSLLFAAADSIRGELGCRWVSIYPKYPKDSFDSDAVLDITTFLRREGYNVNGYFDDAVASINGQHADIELKSNGASLLLEAGIDTQIKKFAKGFYGVDITVAFTGKTEFDMQEYSDKVAQEDAALPIPTPAPPPPADGGGERRSYGGGAPAGEKKR